MAADCDLTAARKDKTRRFTGGIAQPEA